MADASKPDTAETAYAQAAEALPAIAEQVEAPVEAATAPVAEIEFPAKARRVAAKPVKASVKKPAPKKQAASKAKPAAKVAKAPTVSQLKEKIMASKKTADFAEGFQTVVAEAQTKAKEAFEKGSTVFAEAGEFAKGNVEALVESTKIVGAGLKDLGEGFVAEAKSAYETMTADAKEIAAVKSPADFFKLQSEIARRNFDAFVAQSSKNTEAAMKLAGDAFAPISGRVSLAVEKVKKAA